MRSPLLQPAKLCLPSGRRAALYTAHSVAQRWRNDCFLTIAPFILRSHFDSRDSIHPHGIVPLRFGLRWFPCAQASHAALDAMHNACGKIASQCNRCFHG
jgi:hypothetical protein